MNVNHTKVILLFLAVIGLSLLVLHFKYEVFTEQYDGFMYQCLKKYDRPGCNKQWREKE